MCAMAPVRINTFERMLAQVVLCAVLVGQATAQFETRSQTPTNPYPRNVATADFNHDGKPDLAVTSLGGAEFPFEVQVFLGKGDGTFGAPSAYDLGSAGGQWP